MFGKSVDIHTILVRLVIVIMLCVVGYKLSMRNPELREWVAYTFDNYVDERPTYKILFIGNSRTYYNEMPYMVRDIADSAGAQYKVQATMHAPSGRSLKQHWQNSRVQSLLEERWDHVVIQEMSGGHMSPKYQQEFIEYGQKLSSKAKRNSDMVSLFVGWPYSSQIFKGDKEVADEYHLVIQADHKKLSTIAKINSINVGEAWVRQLRKNPDQRLQTDRNHPNIHGSYMPAMAVYKTLPEANLYNVSFIPDDISQQHAEEIIHSADGR